MSLADYLAECPHIHWVGIYMQKEIFLRESHDLFAFAFRQEEKAPETSRTIIKLNSMQLFMEPFPGPYSIIICLNKYSCLTLGFQQKLFWILVIHLHCPIDSKQQVENGIKQASMFLRNWWRVVLQAGVLTKSLVLASTSTQTFRFPCLQMYLKLKRRRSNPPM